MTCGSTFTLDGSAFGQIIEQVMGQISELGLFCGWHMESSHGGPPRHDELNEKCHWRRTLRATRARLGVCKRLLKVVASAASTPPPPIALVCSFDPLDQLIVRVAVLAACAVVERTRMVSRYGRRSLTRRLLTH